MGEGLQQETGRLEEEGGGQPRVLEPLTQRSAGVNHAALYHIFVEIQEKSKKLGITRCINLCVIVGATAGSHETPVSA